MAEEPVQTNSYDKSSLNAVNRKKQRGESPFLGRLSSVHPADDIIIRYVPRLHDYIPDELVSVQNLADHS